MSLTSYQTAPPRVTAPDWIGAAGLPVRSQGQNGFPHRNQVVAPAGVCPPCACPAMCLPRHVFARPGSDLLSHALRRSTIGAEGLHGRVRDGIGCFPLAVTTRPCKHMARPTRTGTAPIGGGRRRSPVRACTRTGPYGLGKVKAGADTIAAAPPASAERGASHGKTILRRRPRPSVGGDRRKKGTAFSAACEVFRPGLLQAGEGTSRSSD